MIDARRLMALWTTYADALNAPIRSFELPRLGARFDDSTYQMGVLNLSRDSSYRESICHTVEAALYRARRMTLEGARIVDIGAESTGDNTDRVGVSRQIDAIRPVVEPLAGEKIVCSVETYHAEVAAALLDAGAGVINLTGRIDDPAFYETVARHEAGIILCYTPGENARSNDALPPAGELMGRIVEFFRERVALAERAGVERIWLDPGFGFVLNLPDGPDRVRYQTDCMLHAFRLRALGWPVAVTMPSSVWLFRDEARCANTSAATLAALSRANLMRAHEVARVQPVIRMLELGGADLA